MSCGCHKSHCKVKCHCRKCCKKKYYKKVCHLVPYYKTKCRDYCKHGGGHYDSSSSMMHHYDGHMGHGWDSRY